MYIAVYIYFIDAIFPFNVRMIEALIESKQLLFNSSIAKSQFCNVKSQFCYTLT